MDSNPTFIIVPGAWHPAEAYSKLARVLRELGHRTVTIELPTFSIRDPPVLTHRTDVDLLHQHLEDLVNQECRQVIIIAHSYGGAPASDCVKGFELQPGNNHGVIGVIFLASFLAEVGESLTDVSNPNAPKNLRAPDPGPDGQYPTMKGENGLEIRLVAENPNYWECRNPVDWLYNGIPEDVVTRCVAAMKPHSAPANLTKVESAAWHHVPCTYIGCSQDRPIWPKLQDEMLAKVAKTSKHPWTRTSIEFGHSPFAIDEGAEVLKGVIAEHVAAITKHHA